MTHQDVCVQSGYLLSVTVSFSIVVCNWSVLWYETTMKQLANRSLLAPALFTLPFFLLKCLQSGAT